MHEAVVADAVTHLEVKDECGVCGYKCNRSVQMQYIMSLYYGSKAGKRT